MQSSFSHHLRSAAWLSVVVLLGALALLQSPVSAHASEFPPGYAQALAGRSTAPPSFLFPPIDPTKGYAVERIAGNVYFITDGLYEAMFVVTKAGVVLVDAPPTLGTKIPKAIASVTSEPVRYFIYSHEHADHVGSAHLFKKTAIYIAQQNTTERLRQDADPKRPVPTRSFGSHLTLHIGGEQIDLIYPGDNEEPGNSFIWLPKERVMMAVDLVFAGHVPFKNLAESEDIPGWIRAQQDLLHYPFRVLVGGHFGLSTRRNVVNQLRYESDLKRFALNGIDSVNFPRLVKRIGFTHPWALFKAYLDAATNVCNRETLAIWRNRLLEANVFTWDNCSTMVNAVRIRWDDLGPFGDGT